MASEPLVKLIFASPQAAANLSLGLAEIYPELCPSSGGDPGETDVAREVQGTVRQAIEQLPGHFRRAFLQQISAATVAGSIIVVGEFDRRAGGDVRKVYFLGNGTVVGENANKDVTRSEYQMGECGA